MKNSKPISILLTWAALGLSSGCMSTGANTAGTVLNASTSSTEASTIVISPNAPTISPSATQQFTTSGGTPPYTYAVMSGGGTIGASTGLYSAPATAATVEISVKDTQGDYAYTTLSISPNSISLTAASATVAGSGTDQMSASGGSGHYSYAVVSGGGTIGASTGLYTAPATATSSNGSVEISVEDSAGAIGYDIITVGTNSSGGTSGSSVRDFTSATTNSVTTGWPASNVLANVATSCYSSAYFTGVVPTTAPYLEAWFDGPTNISQINLMARMVGGIPLAFPSVFQVYITDSTDSTWIQIGNYDSLPTSTGSLVLTLGQTYDTYGVMIVASRLGVDNLGNHYFQLCGLSAQ